MPITKHAYRCTAYLAVLADPIPGEQLRDVDRRTSEAVEAGALVCSCYVGREWTDDPDEVAADLVEVDEEVLVEVDGPEYEYACTGSIVCDPLRDLHGRECESVNQEARVDFYEEVAASRFGATAWTGVGR